MMSVLSVAGIRHVLNIIINDLRPCKIKSRIEDNGIKDQILKTVQNCTVGVGLETDGPSVYHTTQTDGSAFGHFYPSCRAHQEN